MSLSDAAQPAPAARASRSLRARTMSAFLATATAVFAISLVVLHALLRAAELRRIDRDVEFYVHERAAEYLIGGRYGGPKRAVPHSRLPASVRAEFHARHPDAKIEEAFSDNGRDFWFCASTSEGAAIVAECGSNATSLKTKTLHPVDRVGIMTGEFAEEYHGEGYGDLFHLLLAPNGNVLAHSPMPEELLAKMVATGREKTDIHGLEHVHFNDETWAAETEPFFDGSVYVLFHRIDRTVTRAFLVTGVLALALLLATGSFVAWRLTASVSRGLDRVVQASCRARDGDYAARIEHCPGEGTEIDRLVDSVNDMLVRTQGAIHDLKELSDDMAHDLKTPLTRLLARAELAFYEKSDMLPAGDVAEDCRAMLDMVNALLDLSRATNGPRPSPGDSADLADVARSSSNLFSSLAEDKGVSIETDIPEGKITVSARLVHLQRITANLIDNAIKFTPEGGRVKVSVRIDRDMATLAIADTGCGIAESDLPNIFKRFWRSDASRAISGNGLGLALVKAFAESSGGSVSVRSAPGRGSVFTVNIPLLQSLARE